MTNPPPTYQCTNHHHACDCREAKVAELREAAKRLVLAHRRLSELGCFYPLDDGDTDAASGYRDIAVKASADITRLYAELGQ